MWNESRGLREKVVRALAKVGLVWAVAVLGALFMVMSHRGSSDDSTASSVADRRSPAAPAGLALALVVLGVGGTVLASAPAAAIRTRTAGTPTTPDPASDLPLALGLSLLA